jgi:hypothetical protein
MKRILVLLPALVIFLTSAIPPAVEPAKPLPQVTGVDYKTAKANYEEYKGSKLSLKEKIGLKVATSKSMKAEGAGKSQLTAFLLALLIGVLGIHRFYLGIWAFIDMILILTGDLKPKDGDYAKKL